jgi:hypothetical protein
LQWVLADLDASQQPTILDPSKLAEYVGSFGPRRVSLEYFRLSFGRDESGSIDQVIGLHDDGHEDSDPKDD